MSKIKRGMYHALSTLSESIELLRIIFQEIPSWNRCFYKFIPKFTMLKPNKNLVPFFRPFVGVFKLISLVTIVNVDPYIQSEMTN